MRTICAIAALFLAIGSTTVQAQTLQWKHTPRGFPVAHTRVALKETHADALGNAVIVINYLNGDDVTGSRVVWITSTGQELFTKKYFGNNVRPIVRFNGKVLVLPGSSGKVERHVYKNGVIQSSTLQLAEDERVYFRDGFEPRLDDANGFFVVKLSPGSFSLVEVQRYRN